SAHVESLMLRFSVRTLVCVCAVMPALLAVPAPAPAAPYMVSLMQDDDELVYNTSEGRLEALDRMRSLGVEAVRVTMLWRAIAPNTNSRHKPRFNPAKPGAYPHYAWDP